jgi:hypothetical protein
MTLEEMVKIIGAIGGGTLVVGLAGVLRDLILGKRKATTDDKDVVIAGAQKVVIASDTVIDQVLEQMTRLYDAHVKCQEDNEELRMQNAALVERVVALERFKTAMEREGRV